GGDDEARLGQPRREAQAGGPGQLVGAGQPPDVDLAGRGRAIFGLIAGLEDLDLLHELRDCLGAGRAGDRVARAVAVDRIVLLRVGFTDHLPTRAVVVGGRGQVHGTGDGVVVDRAAALVDAELGAAERDPGAGGRGIDRGVDNDFADFGPPVPT